MEVTKDADEQGPAGGCSLWLGGLGPGRVGPAQDVHFSCGQRGAGDSRGTRTTRGPSRGSGLCSRGDRPSTAGFSCPPPRREGACGAPEGRSGQPQVACPRGGGRARPCRGIPSSRCREAAWGCACRRGRAPSCHRKQGQALLRGAQVRAHHCGMCALDALPARGPDGGGALGAVRPPGSVPQWAVSPGHGKPPSGLHLAGCDSLGRATSPCRVSFSASGRRAWPCTWRPAAPRRVSAVTTGRGWPSPRHLCASGCCFACHEAPLAWRPCPMLPLLSGWRRWELSLQLRGGARKEGPPGAPEAGAPVPTIEPC